MDNFTYQTIAQPAESRYTEKASKFYGYAFEVSSEVEIKAALEQVKELHPKARHHCYAWRIGLDKNLYRVNDAGEPSGSAGRPILGQIDSAGLTNTLIIVVRYFGGIKLGIPGLIKAYKASASETIEKAEIIQREVESSYTLTIPYSKVNDFQKLISKIKVTITKEEFSNSEASYTLAFPKALEEQLIQSLEKL